MEPARCGWCGKSTVGLVEPEDAVPGYLVHPECWEEEKNDPIIKSIERFRYDGELQLAFRRIAEWRQQRKDEGDLQGLQDLRLQLAVHGQATFDAVLEVQRRQQLHKEE